jgi:ribosomal-protein-alanine N-acetyltransferase
MSDGIIRPMREGDLGAVMQIERRAYFSPWTEGIFRDCLRVGYSCWVLEGGKGLLGYGVLSSGAGEAHLLNICIAPEFQGQGLGRELLAHFVETARGHGAEALFLEVRPSNVAAVTLYESSGFNQVGCRRDYYPAPRGREDALIFALAL